MNRNHEQQLEGKLFPALAIGLLLRLEAASGKQFANIYCKYEHRFRNFEKIGHRPFLEKLTF